jgi:hypothetical protein
MGANGRLHMVTGGVEHELDKEAREKGFVAELEKLAEKYRVNVFASVQTVPIQISGRTVYMQEGVLKIEALP